MLSSIKQKLTLTYIILIAVPLIIINYVSTDSMTGSILSEIEVDTLKTANIVSDISRNNINEPMMLKERVEEYIGTEDGRVLVLDRDGIVIVDSFNLIENSVIDNEETKLAFNMQEGIGYYYLENYTMQVAVPIVDKTDEGSMANGVVLISTNVDEAFENIHSFSRDLIVLSIVAAFIAVIATIIVSRHISNPIITLSKTARKIGEGNLGETANIKSKDEIGRLAEEFNNMSRRLYHIDKGRTQFIGDVSHELKSPLASIKALIDSLLYGEDDIEVYKEYLRDMDSEIDRLSDLINSLLDLSKIEEQGINTDIYSLEDIVEDTVGTLKPLADKYEVAILVDIKEYPKVLCDEKLIKVALTNLIDNAIKYRDENKPINEVKIIGNDLRNRYELLIVDNGVGIEENELEVVFEKFYRTDGSRSRDTGGAGIGLSIVNRIIKLHKWQITINSRLYRGTVIKMTIPKTSLKASL